MRPEDLLAILRSGRPFSIHLRDGARYDVAGPGTLMIGRSTAIVAFPEAPGSLVMDRTERFALADVARVEMGEG